MRPVAKSMESPKRKRISYLKAGVLIVDQVEPPSLKGAAVWFDLPKDESIKGTVIFWNDRNDQLILYASFLNRYDSCGNGAHNR
jgi:hypothetical protein